VRAAGGDGCRAGWLVVSAPPGRPDQAGAAIVTDLKALMADPALAVLGLDTPIGLDDRPRPGGRVADRAARALLAAMAPAGLRGTGSRVFPAPSRSQLDLWRQGAGYAAVNEAHPAGPRLTLQTFHILPKIDAADRLVASPAGPRLFEVHPEVSFALCAAETLPPKKSAAGRRRREALLAGLGFEMPALASGLGPRSGRWAPDDLLDACIACWSAGRIATGAARPLPDPPETGSAGRKVAIWA
jgi:predicted RNase H-like nuclease